MKSINPDMWQKELAIVLNGQQFQEPLHVIFSSMIDVLLVNDWTGACHESCGAIHVLLNEAGIKNKWYIGEAKIGKHFFDHSWIEINGEVYDIAVAKPIEKSLKAGPVIRGVDISTGKATNVLYGVTSGEPDDDMTSFVKKINLSTYLQNSPIYPEIGTWKLVAFVLGKLKVKFELEALITKYNGKFYSLANPPI